MDSGDLATWIPIALVVLGVVGGGIGYLVASGTAARRNMLEHDLTYTEKQRDEARNERDQAIHERDMARQELAALGRVVTAASAIERFEKALAAHRAELMAAVGRIYETLDDLRSLIQRVYDLIISFRTGVRRD